MRLNHVFVVLTAALLSQTSWAQSLSVDWVWLRAHQCSKASPEIKVSGIPAGAVELKVDMLDNDMPSFNHGGGVVAHDGSAVEATIAQGALQRYVGPCPPNFSSFGHDYQITVTALGADKAALGSGKATKTFSAKAVPQ
ncbi:MAG: hypothetical protein IPH08_14825 [Rhodocyclaceae bacterium]|jgi:phosphatidylethanolamine-binding protein (PEBP) family uncharacterized protein|nr:hypothetical protein [Rhodocyclaceae bacterium]MBK6908277.1 hypothetical protein [Rhodocyclaceae bacterium]